MERLTYFIADTQFVLSDGGDLLDAALVMVIQPDTGFSEIEMKKLNERFKSPRIVMLPVFQGETEEKIEIFRHRFDATISKEGKCSSSLTFFVPALTDFVQGRKILFHVIAEGLIKIIGRRMKMEKVTIVFENSKSMQEFVEEIEPELKNLASKTFKNPYPAADIIIKKDGGVVCVYRKNPPHGWAIPGGFINYGESAEQAAVREAKEETGLDIRDLELFGVFSDPHRDPRFHTISIVFVAQASGQLKAGDDASSVRIFSEADLPEEMAFDHRQILKQFFEKQQSTKRI